MERARDREREERRAREGEREKEREDEERDRERQRFDSVDNERAKIHMTSLRENKASAPTGDGEGM